MSQRVPQDVTRRGTIVPALDQSKTADNQPPAAGEFGFQPRPFAVAVNDVDGQRPPFAGESQ